MCLANLLVLQYSIVVCNSTGSLCTIDCQADETEATENIVQARKLHGHNVVVDFKGMMD